MSTQHYQRPSTAYAGEGGLANRTKYQVDSAASPKVPIASVKVDSDINYLVDAVNELYDTAISSAVPDAAVTTIKLADNSVTTAKIVNANVTTAKIADAAITSAKFRQSAGNSVVGVPGAAMATVSDIVGTTENSILGYASGTVSFARRTPAIFSDVTKNLACVGPASGSDAAPTFRALVNADVPAKTIVVLTSGTSWDVPANVTQVKARLVGAGGGGGGSNQVNGGAAGGGAGETVEDYLTVTPLGTVTYAIGGAGAGGGSTSNGAAGGDTSFGSLIAKGGAGGSRVQVGNSANTGGAGGTGGTGTIKIPGETGDTSVYNSTTGAYSGGGGGNSLLGMGGRTKAIFGGAGTGNAGLGYGAGGGGAYGQNQTGGAGTDGVVIIEY